MERKYQRLQVWQEAIELVTEVYWLTSRFPDSEKFGLVGQMRRAAVSIPSNIAEGAGRGSDKEFRRFLMIARGSLQELETQLIISGRLGFPLQNPEIQERTNRIFAMLNRLIDRMAESQR